MPDFEIEAQLRTVVGKKVKRLRADGLVPITVYGPKTEPVNLQVKYRPLEVLLMKAGGTNLIDLKVNGDTHTVLAREVQRDVIRGDILHADFFALDLTSTIQAEIPVQLINESPIVASRQGILLTGPNTLTVETMPTNLMNQVEIDLSVLTEIGQGIYVSDVDLGEGVQIINDPEEMIARVVQSSAARAEEDLEDEGEEEEALTSAEPEVIARGKDEEEDE